MKKKLCFSVEWTKFTCEKCQNIFSVDEMFYEISGNCIKDSKDVTLTKIIMLCEECKNNANQS